MSRRIRPVPLQPDAPVGRSAFRPLCWLVFWLALSAAPAQAARQIDEDFKPDAQLRQRVADFDAKALEKAIHQRVNAARQENGLAPLAWDEKLAEIARGHARSMAEGGYVSHVDRQGRDPTRRARDAGYVCRKVSGLVVRQGVAENLFQGGLFSSMTQTSRPGGTTRSYDWTAPELIAELCVQGWLASPGHRKNLLDQTFGVEGLGVAVSPQGKVYVVQDFC